MNFSTVYHIYDVKKIMFFVIIACIPGIFAKCYFFGPSILIQILFSVFVAIFLEIIVLKIRGKNIKKAIFDNSAIVTAVLFSVSLPCFIPGWIIFFGLFFSIVISKHLYGGIGQNIFNPAMVGYAVLLISFPIYLNQWMEVNHFNHIIYDIKYSIHALLSNSYSYNKHFLVDFFTQATPLDLLKNHIHYNDSDKIHDTLFLCNKNIFLSCVWINISFLLGGIFLLYKRIICWRIPLSFLCSLIFISGLTCYISNGFFASPIFHVFSGGTMICAFFIATDPVTTASTNIGRIIFGVIIGIVTWIIRNYSDYPDSIAFSVLFGNMVVPLIDHYVQLSGYGRNKL